MQGDKSVIDALNDVLMAELTAINMYYIHYKMQENWGYNKLAHHAKEETMGEMKHADKMIERILYLDGTPDMAKYDTILVGGTCEEQLKNQYTLETKHVARLQKHIALCIQKSDFGSKEILDGILEDTEESCDWLETQFQRIKDIGIENYLTEHMHE
ncbi:MAG: bacterioferritin [Nitrospinaceae bacterium]|nr:MAG: bacterioferritin [Nitrospinaceae bacterium]